MLSWREGENTLNILISVDGVGDAGEFLKAVHHIEDGPDTGSPENSVRFMVDAEFYERFFQERMRRQARGEFWVPYATAIGYRDNGDSYRPYIVGLKMLGHHRAQIDEYGTLEFYVYSRIETGMCARIRNIYTQYKEEEQSNAQQHSDTGRGSQEEGA